VQGHSFSCRSKPLPALSSGLSLRSSKSGGSNPFAPRLDSSLSSVNHSSFSRLLRSRVEVICPLSSRNWIPLAFNYLSVVCILVANKRLSKWGRVSCPTNNMAFAEPQRLRDLQSCRRATLSDSFSFGPLATIIYDQQSTESALEGKIVLLFIINTLIALSVLYDTV
jgi:hypothetical protein